jgi:hypothetical protein
MGMYHVGTFKKISKNHFRDIGNFIFYNHVLPSLKKCCTQIMVASSFALFIHLLFQWFTFYSLIGVSFYNLMLNAWHDQQRIARKYRKEMSTHDIRKYKKEMLTYG